MAKHKSGLHKQISRIFDGVLIPREGGGEQPSDRAVPERSSYVPPKPLAPSKKAGPIPKPAHPVPSPKPRSPTWSLPEVAGAGQPKAGTGVKAVGQPAWQQSLGQIRDRLFAPKPGISATRQKTMVTLVPVLFIVLILVLVQVLGTGSPKRITAGEPEPAKGAGTVSKKIDWQIPAVYPAGLRDPMQLAQMTTAQVRADKLIVKGIVYSEDEPTAVIGTQIVREREKVLDATVVKINKDSVEFEKDGKRWTQKVER